MRITTLSPVIFSTQNHITVLLYAETKELFVSMPRYKTNEKDENQKDIYQDICNPITKEFREQQNGDI